MADHFTALLDFRPLSTNSIFNLFAFSPSNQCYASRFNAFRRRPLHLTFLSKPSSSSNLDVVSTHEHSDGSLLFRFGDPSEVAKKEFDTVHVKGKAETEGNDGYVGVKVFDKYREERAMTTSLNSIQTHTETESNSSESIDVVVEGDNGLTEIEFMDGEIEAGSSGFSANLEKTVDEDQTDGLPTSVSSMPGPVEEVSDAHVFNASLETVITTDESANSEHKNVKTEVENEIIKDENLRVESPSSEVIEGQNLQFGMQNTLIGEATRSNMNDFIAPERQDVLVVNENGVDINGTEAKLVSNNIIAEVQVSEVGTGFPNKIVKDVNKSDKIQLPIVSPQMETEPGTDTMEKSTEENGAETLTLNLILGSARTEVDDNVQNGDLIEPSAHEATDMEYTESATRSKEMSKTELALSSGAALLPHPSKVLTGGEDAYFIGGQTWLGVADGVGLWSFEGTSPGYFAKELIKTCERLVSDCNGDSVNNLVELLNLSVAETRAPGSSTILIAHFDGQALLVANVGDSGFIILRHSTVYKRSSPMRHAYHFPLQVASGDDPSRLAEFYRVELEEGDVIITATNGLLDNLYDQEISSMVTKSLAAEKELEEIAELLATKAQLIGGSAYGRSPFADDAQVAGYSGCTGGRLDDVAVILSLVRRSNRQ